MTNFVVNRNTRLEPVKLWMDEVIFASIDENRDYLKTWLPFIQNTLSINDTRNFLQSVINQPDKKKDDVYSIWYKEEFAGLIGFKDTDWLNKKTELGYWLVEKIQGKGIVSSSVERLCHFAFQKLKMNRVQIKVAIGNSKSSAIPKKLGFQFEGIERAGENHGNKFLDLEIYSLIKKDTIL